ncbi:MAG: hypothetical protein MUO27_08415, partial [Sedimentisphaerales bacterium]|nr:hypothetical protein [Sedimentisphaerales bacterium]
ILLRPAFCGAIEYKGMSYTGWGQTVFTSTDSNTSLSNLQKTGYQWVAINIWWYQDTLTSTTIYPLYPYNSVKPESVKVAVDRCHQLGMKVMLKPMLDVKDGTWRARIVPSTAWFTAYHGFINYWADFAEANNCEMLCIGCEFEDTSSWATQWRSVASDVRSHYSGPITYAVNHDGENAISWWDALDYIGIDAYYALTSINNPTLTQLKNAWTSRANSIQTWRNNNWPDMNIMFTEVGYASYDGTNRYPWDGPGQHPEAALDINEQNNCYEALLSVCRNRPWWKGAFWWNWETNPNFGGMSDKNFSPQGKYAETVTLRRHYITLNGDLDDDRDVDVDDLVMFCDFWPDQYYVGWPDFNNDKKVNFKDFALLAANWQQSFPLP